MRTEDERCGLPKTSQRILIHFKICFVCSSFSFALLGNFREIYWSALRGSITVFTNSLLYNYYIIMLEVIKISFSELAVIRPDMLQSRNLHSLNNIEMFTKNRPAVWFWSVIHRFYLTWNNTFNYHSIAIPYQVTIKQALKVFLKVFNEWVHWNWTANR